jgi:hypothetical protein
MKKILKMIGSFEAVLKKKELIILMAEQIEYLTFKIFRRKRL